MEALRKFTNRALKILAVPLVIAISVFIIQIVLSGKQTASQTPITPTDTPEASLIVQFPQKALWNNYFTVVAKAAPGTTCELLYVPPASESQEMSSVADENGQCIWRWKIDESQGKGNGRLIITIDGKSETHFFEIRSSF